MQHAADSRSAGLRDHRSRIGFGFARVDDDGTIQLLRERQLRREGATLQIAR